MPSLTPILVAPNGVGEALIGFSASDIKRRYRTDAEQGAFSTNLVEFGEGIPEAASITLRGPIFSSTRAQYLEKKKELYTKLTRKGNRLMLGRLLVPLGTLISDNVEWEDALEGRVDTYTFEFRLLSPFWSAPTSELASAPVVPGSLTSLTTVSFDNAGNAPAFPTIQTFFRNVHKLSIELNGRTLVWSYYNSAGEKAYWGGNIRFNYQTGVCERWVYNAETGVTSNLTDVRNEISPDSQFAPLVPGRNTVFLRLSGRDLNGSDLFVSYTAKFY